MKFLLFDRVVSHTPGKFVRAELDIPDGSHAAYAAHFPRGPLYPRTLVIESMVQVLGWLAMEAHDYTVLSVLAGLEDAQALGNNILEPGKSRLVIEATLLGTNRRSSVGTVSSEDENLIQQGYVKRVLYAHVPHDDPDALRARFQEHGGAP